MREGSEVEGCGIKGRGLGMKVWEIRGKGGMCAIEIKSGESDETGEMNERDERECKG